MDSYSLLDFWSDLAEGWLYSTVCFPCVVLVSFGDVASSLELSEGLFRGFELTRDALACLRLEDGVGDGGVSNALSSSSVDDPGSSAVT